MTCTSQQLIFSVSFYLRFTSYFHSPPVSPSLGLYLSGLWRPCKCHQILHHPSWIFLSYHSDINALFMTKTWILLRLITSSVWIDWPPGVLTTRSIDHWHINIVYFSFCAPLKILDHYSVSIDHIVLIILMKLTPHVLSITDFLHGFTFELNVDYYSLIYSLNLPLSLRLTIYLFYWTFSQLLTTFYFCWPFTKM